jgi:hypothetical protein
VRSRPRQIRAVLASDEYFVGVILHFKRRTYTIPTQAPIVPGPPTQCSKLGQSPTIFRRALGSPFATRVIRGAPQLTLALETPGRQDRL